jgi:hypothetical protein
MHVESTKMVQQHPLYVSSLHLSFGRLQPIFIGHIANRAVDSLDGQLCVLWDRCYSSVGLVL